MEFASDNSTMMRSWAFLHIQKAEDGENMSPLKQSAFLGQIREEGG